MQVEFGVAPLGGAAARRRLYYKRSHLGSMALAVSFWSTFAQGVPSSSPLSPPAFACADSQSWSDDWGDGCDWYADNDPGCTEYDDHGQLANCPSTCGRCLPPQLPPSPPLPPSRPSPPVLPSPSPLSPSPPASPPPPLPPRTPQELIQSGLFDNLAIPCFPGPHHTAPLPDQLPRPFLCGWMMKC